MQVNLVWNLYQEETLHTIQRHCSTCGRIRHFTDTGRIRRNANGKNIFEYAIYRCEKGHTWNQKLRRYKAGESGQSIGSDDNEHNGNGNPEPATRKIQPVSLSYYQNQGISKLCIQLDVVEGGWRLDKLLAAHITDVSRSRIRALIESGRILLNACETKSGVIIKQKGTIQINLRDVWYPPAKTGNVVDLSVGSPASLTTPKGVT